MERYKEKKTGREEGIFAQVQHFKNVFIFCTYYLLSFPSAIIESGPSCCHLLYVMGDQAGGESSSASPNTCMDICGGKEVRKRFTQIFFFFLLVKTINAAWPCRSRLQKKVVSGFFFRFQLSIFMFLFFLLGMAKTSGNMICVQNDPVNPIHNRSDHVHLQVLLQRCHPLRKWRWVRNFDPSVILYIFIKKKQLSTP